MNKHGVKPFTALLAVMGPGLFLIGYNIGTGSVTTMAMAGSKWGMSLTWTVLLSCLFTYVGVITFGRYTLTTGETVLYAVKKHFRFGAAISMFIMATVILAEFAGVAGLMAIIVDLLREWIVAATGSEAPAIKAVLTAVISVILFVILWCGSYTYLEKLLAVLVAVMGVAFLATAVMIVPSWRDILAGLKPAIPAEPGANLTVAGMAGTTFSSAVLYCRSITLKAKGWNLNNTRQAKLDAITSVVAMFVISIAVMICAAGTLFVINKPIENAVDMVRTLEPLAGKFAFAIFVIGVVGAGISSLIPTILIAPWLISDYTNTGINPKSIASRIFVIGGILFGLYGPYMKTKPVSLMIITMALLAIVLPLSTIAITILLNKKHMGPQKNSPMMNIACAAMILFSIVMSWYGVLGIVDHFG